MPDKNLLKVFHLWCWWNQHFKKASGVVYWFLYFNAAGKRRNEDWIFLTQIIVKIYGQVSQNGNLVAKEIKKKVVKYYDKI